MSSSDYRMNLIWTSHGQQLRADLERNVGGLVGYRNELRRSNREMGQWGQQMRAIGTTIRYALAGATIYGVAGAVRGLGQFLDRLGEIDAVAARMDQQGRLQSLGRGLNQLGNEAISLSNQYGIMVDDILQHQQRFQSSFTPAIEQNIRMTQDWSRQMSVLTLALGGEVGDPMALSGGVAGMIQGMGPGAIRDPIKSAERLSDIIAQVIAETPNITGADIARDIGRLGGAQVSLRMTPEEIFAVYGTAARLGGASAVIGRGVTQLLTAELVNPQTEDQKRAFRAMGLPSEPGQLREMGGWNIMMQLMERFQPPTGNARALGLVEDPEQAMSAAGIPRKQVDLLFQMFGRMESARQFMNLIAVGGKDALEDFIEGIRRADEANRSQQMADIRNQQRTYQQLGQVTRNFGLTLARGIDPVLRPTAGGIVRGGRWVADQSPAAVAGVVGGAGGAQLAARLIFGTGLAGLAGRGLSRIPGVGTTLGRLGLGNLASRAPALGGAALVGAGTGAFQATGMQGAGSRANPFWVVIDPLTWFMPGAPSGGGLGGQGGGVGGAESAARRFGPTAAALAAARFARIAGPVGGTMAAAHFGVPDKDEEGWRKWVLFGSKIPRRRWPWQRDPGQPSPAVAGEPGEMPALAHLFGFSVTGAAGAFSRRGTSGRADFIERMLFQQQLRTTQDQARMRAGGAFGMQVAGEAGVTITLQPTPELAAMFRDLNRRERVPVKLHGLSGGQRPQFRGQPKTQRGGR